MTKLQERNPKKRQQGGVFDAEKLFKSYLPAQTMATPPFLPVEEEDSESALAIEPWMTQTNYWTNVPTGTTTKGTTKGQKFQDLGATTFKSLGKKKSQEDKDETKDKVLNTVTSLIKPGISVGSALLNLKYLKQSRDVAKNIKSPHIEAATMPNRPIQQLSPEIVAMYMKNIEGLQTKKTSDETSNRIAEQMLSLNKLAAMDKLAAKQAEYLTQERARHDATSAKNAVASVQARNESAKYAADVANKKAMINAQYFGKKQDFTNRWIEEALIKPMEKRIAYNMGKEAIEKQEKWNRMQAQIVNAQNAMSMDPSEENKKRLSDLLGLQKEMSSAKLPYYSGTSSYLIPRRNE